MRASRHWTGCALGEVEPSLRALSPADVPAWSNCLSGAFRNPSARSGPEACRDDRPAAPDSEHQVAEDGLWRGPPGIAAAVGLTLCFIGAVAAHLRVGDYKGAPPAAVLTESGCTAHQGRLARPGGADDGGEPGALGAHVHLVEGPDLGGAGDPALGVGGPAEDRVHVQVPEVDWVIRRNENTSFDPVVPL
ncbi:DoxX family protein [Streptomyces sp. NBC_01166]|uniref:DoxX family protein n=1 Tax=Streptomyces sp. NBC_01166 TaxID=2903755 RepID=UPI0038700E57